jgi:uncharacterized membrane protein YhaH (DUF805 family)
MANSLTSNEFLFSFDGRINRVKYWYALFASVISCLIFLAVLAAAIAGIFGAGVKSVNIGLFDIFSNPLSFPFRASFNNAGATSTATLISLLFYAGGTPIFVVSMWFLAATTIKRLHDRNKSGWWIVLFIVAPNLLGKFGDSLGDSDVAVFLGLIAFVLNIWGAVELLFLKGTSGPNRFRPDPLAPGDTRAHAASHWDQHRELEFPVPGAGPWPGSHVKRSHD